MNSVRLLDTRELTNGPHRIVFEAQDAAGNVRRVERVVIVKNPDIDIVASDEDRWEVHRRRSDTGRVNRLEVDKSVSVRINGTWR